NQAAPPKLYRRTVGQFVSHQLRQAASSRNKSIQQLATKNGGITNAAMVPSTITCRQRPCDELAANPTRSPPPVAKSVARPLTSRLFIHTDQFTALACTESGPAQGTAQ